jgi:hypothetical protein
MIQQEEKQESAESAGVMSLVNTVSPMAGNVAHVTAKQYDLSKWVASGQVVEREL